MRIVLCAALIAAMFGVAWNSPADARKRVCRAAVPAEQAGNGARLPAGAELPKLCRKER